MFCDVGVAYLVTTLCMDLVDSPLSLVVVYVVLFVGLLLAAGAV